MARLVIFLTLLWTLSAGFLPRIRPGESRFAYWSAGLVATLLIFGSVRLQESARALAARRVPDSELRLMVFGTLVSALLSVFLLFSAGWYAFFTAAWPVLVDVLRYGSLLNLALAALGLLPIFWLGARLAGGTIRRAHAPLRRERTG